MKRSPNKRLMWAAMAAASLIAVPAMAQIRATNDGHANDSSNRVGSGGYNSGGYVYNNGYNSNSVIYGNVTGGSYFTGPHERDPRAFMGPVSSLGDDFIRGTAGAPMSYQPGTPTYTPQPFFGSSRGVAPPTGTQRLGFTGTYVGATNVPIGPLSLDNEITANTATLKQSLGDSNPLGLHRSLVDPNTGDLTQTDSNEAILGTSSALFGLQGLPGQPGENAGNLPLFASPSLVPGGTDKYRMSRSELDQMRSELQSTPTDQAMIDQLNGNDNGASGDNGNGNGTANGQRPGALPSSSLAKPAEGPNSRRLNSKTGTSQVNSANLTNGLNTAEAQQGRITLVQPNQPGAVNPLRDRFDQYLTPQMRSLRANAQYLNQLTRLRSKAAGTGAGATTQPSAGGLGAGTGDTGAIGSAPAIPMPGSGFTGEPVQINSLAKGVTAKGLHELLASGEDLMKKGKYISAVEKYNAAEQVAPDDMLIALGRANAELGAGFYHRAAIDLHRAFDTDPALLQGRYSVADWLGEDRVKAIEAELTGLAKSDANAEDPVFLLAYLSYNTGDAAKASDYLKQARARSGGKDALLGLIETRWRPTSGGTSGLNK